jgi:spore coat polysaccharide biosynthesis protein SpsF
MDSDPIAVVQARMSSTRLPGKTLAEVGGQPMLALLLGRLSRARHVSEIVVATSTDPIDDPVARVAAELGIRIGRGPRDDVLARFLLIVGARAGPVVRITGDCPLIDPWVVDATVECFLATPGCAYASNIEPRSFPDGLDVEVVDADALRAIGREPLATVDREHVTSAIRIDPERFPTASLSQPENLGELRWTVDEPADLDFVRAVIGRLGDRRYEAGVDEILAAVRQEPSLITMGGARRG